MPRGSWSRWCSSVAAGALLSVAALLATGCATGGSGGDAPRTAAPPDRLTVALEGGGYGAFRIDLECAIADRDVCRDVLDALAREDAPETCTPTRDDGRRIVVTGTIAGDRVSAILRRRTDCETVVYDAVYRAVR